MLQIKLTRNFVRDWILYQGPREGKIISHQACYRGVFKLRLIDEGGIFSIVFFQCVLELTLTALNAGLYGSISGEFGRAMVHILARRSRAKMPMARPNEPDIMLPKRTKKGAISYLPDPNSS